MVVRVYYLVKLDPRKSYKVTVMVSPDAYIVGLAQLWVEPKDNLSTTIAGLKVLGNTGDGIGTRCQTLSVPLGVQDRPEVLIHGDLSWVVMAAYLTEAGANEVVVRRGNLKGQEVLE